MVGATLQHQQQQGTMSAPSAEDETLKWNTDCVYFLTSPLACKKGAECEYRHSEYARVNPRDCYFWLNGNCLNPKCGFRHPPLDGLFGTEEEAFAGSFLPSVAPAIHTQYSGKVPVQCIYFQKGFCSRGDTCGFLHGPNPSSSKTSQQIKSAPSTDIPPTKPHTSHRKEVKTRQANVAKAVEAPAEIKPAPKLENGLRRNGIDRNLPISKNLHDEIPKCKETNLSPVVNGNPSCVHQLQVPDDHGILNGKDPDESLRESSPGFDVLVDDHSENQYGRKSNPENEYDYNSVGDMDQETYRDLRDYDSYENIRGRYAWEQHRSSSSERMLSGQPHRGYSKVDSPELSDDIDLRYRLSKHRIGNGLRSVVSHDFANDNNMEDRIYWDGSSSRESSISGRLCGRIKLPRRCPDLRVERERDRIRLSPPVRPEIQGRLRDRIKARDYDSEGINPRGGRMRRETMDDRFAGPKSLAELKGPRKRKQMDDDNRGDLSFKGPMPLSEILKRKRVSKAGDDQKEAKENQTGSSNNTTDKKVINNNEESKSTAVENSLELPNEGEPETGRRMIAEDHEYEGGDQREGGEYEHEPGDDGECYEEGENAEAEEDVDDDDDDDDDDDFAKKIGVVSS